MARDTVNRVVEVGGLNDPLGCQTDGYILMGGDGWQPTLFIRLVQDYGVDVDVSESSLSHHHPPPLTIMFNRWLGILQRRTETRQPKWLSLPPSLVRDGR